MLIGALEEFFPSLHQHFSYTIVSTLVSLASFLFWIEVDAAHRGYDITKGLRYLIILITVVGLPVYIIKSRGWLGLFKFLLCAALSFFVFSLVAAGMLLAHEHFLAA